MQSIYLILALIFCGIIFVVPLSLILPETNIGNLYKLDVFGIKQASETNSIIVNYTYALTIILGLSFLIISVSVFLYKNRPLQIKLCRIVSILILLFVVLIFYYTDQMAKLSVAEASTVYVTGTYLPFIIVMLLLLAIRGIKKDEELVRSADRLR